MADCVRCGATMPDGRNICPHCGTTVQYRDNHGYPEMPMKWYKFLVYFSLIFGSVLGFLGGFINFVESCTLLLDYPFFGFLGIIYAGCTIIFAIYGLFVRYQLKHYRRFAPYFYYTLLVVPPIVELIYTFLTYVIYALFYRYIPSGTMFPVFLSVSSNAAILACSIVYFHKRRHLFIN